MHRRAFIGSVSKTAAGLALMRPLGALTGEGNEYGFSDAKENPSLRQLYLDQLLRENPSEYIKELDYVDFYSYFISEYCSFLTKKQGETYGLDGIVQVEITDDMKREYGRKFIDVDPGLNDLGNNNPQKVSVYSKPFEIFIEDEFDTYMDYVVNWCKHIFDGVSSFDGKKVGAQSFHENTLNELLLVMASYDTLKQMQEKGNMHSGDFSKKIGSGLAGDLYWKYAYSHYSLQTKALNNELGEEERDAVIYNLERFKDQMP